MRLLRCWLSTHKKELRRYAFYRVPPDTEVLLFPRILWIMVIQLIAMGAGLASKSAVPWWFVCILPFVATTILVAVCYRERDYELDGFYRYSSTFCGLLGFSLIELTVFIAIWKSVQNALFYSFAVFLITVVCFLYSIYRQINRGVFSEKTQKDISSASFIGAALGFGTHLICKRAFSGKAEEFLVVIVGGLLAGVASGIAAMFWLKSIGAKQNRDGSVCPPASNQ